LGFCGTDISGEIISEVIAAVSGRIVSHLTKSHFRKSAVIDISLPSETSQNKAPPPSGSARILDGLAVVREIGGEKGTEDFRLVLHRIPSRGLQRIG
jgi:hypothetical protein